MVMLSAIGCERVKAHRKIQDGNKAYYAGKYDEAIKLYEQATQLEATEKIGWYNLGLAHLALFTAGKKTPQNEAHAQGAIGAFKQYLQLEKNPADKESVQNFLLQTYIDSGHYEEALAYFEARLKDNPKDTPSLYQLARINEDAGNYLEAIKWHKQRAGVETSKDQIYDAWYRVGELNWRRRLNKKLTVIGEERVKIADEGIAALQQALAAKDEINALVMKNLNFRQRAMGQGQSYFALVDVAQAEHGAQQVKEKKITVRLKALRAAVVALPDTAFTNRAALLASIDAVATTVAAHRPIASVALLQGDVTAHVVSDVTAENRAPVQALVDAATLVPAPKAPVAPEPAPPGTPAPGEPAPATPPGTPAPAPAPAPVPAAPDAPTPAPPK